MMREHALGSYAWSPQEGATIVVNVLRDVGRPDPLMRGVTAVFPECGCGYHEWAVVRALLTNDHRVHTVVLMDARIDPAWVLDWHCIAAECNTKLVVLNSYVELEKWTAALSLSSNAMNQNVMVIYINGSLRFGPVYCRQIEPEVCKEHAVRFWQWCHYFASNRSPINYVGISTLWPAQSKTWSDLATTFSSHP